MKNGKYLNINLYEIRLEENIICNKDLLDAFLFDCQCALFLLDMTNPKSIRPIRNIMNYISEVKYPYLTEIIIQNKLDIMEEIPHEELKKFNNFYYDKNNIELSLKTGENLDELLNNIYEAINSDSPEKKSIPINQVSKFTLRYYQKEKMEKIKKNCSLHLVGDTCVGKTNFLTRFAQNAFVKGGIATVGMNNERRMIEVNNNHYILTIWDFGGTKMDRNLPRSYYKNADCILLFFDVNDSDSFEDVHNWMKDINEYSGKNEEEEEEKGPIVYLIGNKIDKDLDDLNYFYEKRKIKKEEGEKLADELGVKYYEISVKWNLNIEEVMARIILDCLENDRFKRIKTLNTTNVKITKKKKGFFWNKKEKEEEDKKINNKQEELSLNPPKLEKLAKYLNF